MSLIVSFMSPTASMTELYDLFVWRWDEEEEEEEEDDFFGEEDEMFFSSLI